MFAEGAGSGKRMQGRKRQLAYAKKLDVNMVKLNWWISVQKLGAPMSLNRQ